MTSPSCAASLDFEALLSRDYRPARLTRLITRESYHPEKWNDKKKGTTSAAASSAIAKHKRFLLGTAAEDIPDEATTSNSQLAEETSRLVLSLVTQTKAFTKHLPGEPEPGKDALSEFRGSGMLPPPRVPIATDISPAFHEVELGDWESNINWEGCPSENSENNSNNNAPSNSNSNSNNNSTTTNTESGASGGATTPFVEWSDPTALLRKPRNPYLDTLVFDETTVCWEGTTEEFLRKARNAPLILELGVAGQSVARHVYQNTVLSAQRPTPALQSEAYRQRMEKDWSHLDNITSTADVSAKGSLHADKDKMEALIQARQKKRAQMAKDKTNRVTEAMGTLAMGGGRGRTITSSLMGPGGTERTGRPSRNMTTSATHDTEYIEQLDLVSSHTMVRDLSKVLLRQYHRPKLPLSVVRQDLAWQFQIRYIPTGKKTEASTNSSSYQGIMMGTHPGAISKAKLRTEADLSPSEGKLVLLEYVEEVPPVQLSKGMACKIVNYYRGDKSRCPVSAGGGDRPARRKRGVDATASGATGKDGAPLSSSAGKVERLGRLDGPNRRTTVLDWVGKLPTKSQKDRSEKDAIDILPEGVTELLHPKVHGPFIGEIEEGTTLTGLVSNMFVAPMFRHEPESTDFLMILTPPGGVARPGQRESMGVVLRDLPTSAYTIGQTEPRTRVWAPNTQGEKNFVGPFVSYQIARALTRMQAREGHGLRFDELQDRVLPNLELPANALRQRLKQVAVYDKNTQIWTTKAIGYEDYPGVEALGKSIAPEGVSAYETACAAKRRLFDLGIQQLLEKGSHTIVSMSVTMVYLAGQLNAARELSRKTKKLLELSRSNKSIPPLQINYYEKAAGELESLFKSLRQRHEVAQFIYEELQLAPWHLTGEFIEVHKKAEGTGMMKLTGLGDPSGQGEGFSFLREVDTKSTKAVTAGALTAPLKKITGTEDDLRKLTMKQMASLLRSYGMPQKKIDTLKRWDRVHCIRDLSTKAASDGIGDGLERFARGEKMKLSEQKQMYRDRIQVIWRRQLAALAVDSGDRGGGGDGGAAAGDSDMVGGPDSQAAKPKKASEGDKDNSDSDSEDDDDLAATLEEEMMDRTEGNQLVAAHARGDAEGGLGQLRAATQDENFTKDARELAALKRQREEERAAQEGFQGMKASDEALAASLGGDRKVIRRRITKTYPDGRQTTTFKFILHPEEVGKIMARLQQKGDEDRPRNREVKYEYGIDEKPPCHAMFEDEDDYEYSSKGRLQSGKRRGVVKQRRGVTVAPGRVVPRPRSLTMGKLKTKISKEERIRKRKREEEELEVYASSAKRKGTNNRRERGSIRDRRPHVIFAEKLETIRAAVEARPYAGPFVKPVNRRLIPRYYEVITHPIDLQTIRDKIQRYEYRTADGLLRDFELMKSNAIKFNGQASPIAQEAVAIYDFVRDQVKASWDELTALEEAVKEQMSGKPKKKRKMGSAKKSSAGGSGNVTNVSGVAVNLGDLTSSMQFDGEDSDSGDESIGDILDL